MAEDASSGVVHKLDSDGNYIWHFEEGGKGSHLVYLTAIAVDSAGNVYASGHFEKSLVVNKQPYESKKYKNEYTSDLFTLKLDPDGNFKWFKRWGGIGDDFLTDIAIGPNDNLFLVGHLQRGGYLDPESYEAWVGNAEPGPDDDENPHNDFFGKSSRTAYGAFVLNSPNLGVSQAQTNEVTLRLSALLSKRTAPSFQPPHSPRRSLSPQ